MKELGKIVRSAFEERFKRKPLLVASPGRINLIGEHTDYNNGFVFPAAIDKYIVSALSESEKGTTQIYSMDMEEALDLDLNKLTKQESGSWKNYVIGVVNELQKKGKQIDDFNLVFGGNIPIGAGLSSSAALENSIVFGLNELFRLGLTKEEMVLISMKAEHDFAGVKCGIMDQFTTMYGQTGYALFLNCADLSHEHVPIQMEDYQLLLINSNVKHKLTDSPYNQRKTECKDGLRLLQSKFANLNSLCDANLEQLNALKEEMPPLVYKRCRFVMEENERVKAAKSAIENKHWAALGDLLFASHSGLRNLYEVSCEELDFMVEKAKEHIAVIGSRMMGGGFGGCTLNLIRNEAVEDFASAVNSAYQLKFGRPVSTYSVNISNGTHIIVA